MMKRVRSSGFVKSRAALSVTIIVALLTTIEIPALTFGVRTHQPTQTQSNLSQGDTNLSSASAIASEEGVLLRWRTSYEIDNLGFNVYRLKDGQRIRVNREIIPGSVFIVGDKIPLRSGYSYSHFDSGGKVDSTYYIEAVSLSAKLKLFEPLRPVASDKLLDFKQSSLGQLTSNDSSTSVFQREYPGNGTPQVVPNGPLDDQWTVAAEPGLKIFIKHDGWYRVTQQQIVAAGFNPTVDVRNLLLYVDGQEMAMRTSKSRGQFSNGDYFEFYGRGLDTPTTDIRTHYLIAGSREGKRIRGEVQLDGPTELPPPVLPPAPAPVPVFSKLPSKSWFNVVQFLYGRVFSDPRTEADAKVGPRPKTATELNNLAGEVFFPTPLLEKPIEVATAVSAVAQPEQKRESKRQKKKKRTLKQKYHHSTASTARAPSFNYTIEKKERLIYFVSLLNGDAENFFGPLVYINPVIQTLDVKGLETTADGPATLEVSLQGTSFETHQTRVSFNDTELGVITFFGREHPVVRLPVSLSLIREEANFVKLVELGGSNDACLLDSVRFTYPHAYKADNDSLRFSLRSTQPAKIDGFATQNVRLIDYTDPLSVTVTRPIVEASGSSYAISVAAGTVRSKFGRLLYAISEGQAEQPAGFALNQPSILNQSSSGADLVIVSHKDLLQSVTPLADLRRSQGFTVSVVDIEDIYDEFSFGAHGPKAIRDFLARASSSWTKVPRYVIFAGDASLDPRNYQGKGNFDFVPTKLVDATYNETASDDWFSDFDGDGTADIPVGRLPVRTPSEASLVISKIVNFTPTNVPQSAFLVADDPTGYYFNFEHSNDEVQSLLSSSLTVQRLNRRTETSDATARANIIAKFNQGQALVNYTGHGNVDIWTGGAIFTSADAFALTNGNRLPLVVVMDCLNGYFHDPALEGIAESLLKAPSGGAVAAFASSGLTLPDGQHAMSRQLYILLYGSQSIALGDAIRTAKVATTDIDVRRTWIFFGDPSMKIR